MAEPRRPIANLPGFGETSISTAKPIDAFAGAPQLDKAKTLADAFSNLGVAGQKAAAQAQAKQEKERLDLMAVEAEGTARKMIAESETGFINAVQLGEAYADLSDAIVARIVVRENSDAFYNMTKEKLSGLGDGIIMDKAGLNAMYTELETQAVSATEGFIHAQSGALDGVARAIQEMSGQHASRRDGIVRKRAETVTAGQVATLLNSTSDVSTIVDGINAIDAEPSPFDRTGRKGIIVDALIQWDINNPSNNPMYQKVIDAVPWLKGAVTDAKVASSQGAIANAQWNAYTRNRQMEEDDANDRLTLGKADVNALIEANNVEELDALQEQMALTAATSDNAMDVRIANSLWTYIENQKTSAQVPPDLSAANAITTRQQLVAEATTGGLSLDQARLRIEGATNIRPEDKAQLLSDLPNIIQGFGIVGTEAHNTAYRQRLGSVVDAYSQHPTLLGISFTLAGVGESADTIARDIWDNTTIQLIEEHMADNDGQPPSASALRGIYDKAEEVVQTRLGQLREINTAGTATMTREAVNQIVNPQEQEKGTDGILPKDNPASPEFQPQVGNVYVAPNDGKPYKYTGVNSDDLNAPENWVLVDGDGNDVVNNPPKQPDNPPAASNEITSDDFPTIAPMGDLGDEGNGVLDSIRDMLGIGDDDEQEESVADDGDSPKPSRRDGRK